MSVPGDIYISFVHVYRYRCIVLKYSAVLGNSWEQLVLGNNILVLYRYIGLKYSAVLGNSWELVVLGNNILVL